MKNTSKIFLLILFYFLTILSGCLGGGTGGTPPASEPPTGSSTTGAPKGNGAGYGIVKKFQIEKNTNLTFQLADQAGALSTEITQYPKFGVFSLASGSTGQYEPKQEFIGTDFFQYTYDTSDHSHYIVDVTVNVVPRPHIVSLYLTTQTQGPSDYPYFFDINAGSNIKRQLRIVGSNFERPFVTMGGKQCFIQQYSESEIWCFYREDLSSGYYKVTVTNTQTGLSDIDNKSIAVQTAVDFSFGTNGSITQSDVDAILPFQIGSQTRFYLGKHIYGGLGLSTIIIQRILSNSQPDLSFGQGGEVNLDVPNKGRVRKLLLQSDGKLIVIFGDSILNILRFSADGKVDPSFTHTVFNGESLGSTSWGTINNYHPTLFSLSSENKLIGVVSGGIGLDKVSIFRLNSDGTPDTQFGNGGVTSLNLDANIYGQHEQFPIDLAIQSDGKILLAVQLNDFTKLASTYALVRLTNDGSMDTSFGNGSGLFTLNSSSSTVLIQSLLYDDLSGDIFVGGQLSTCGILSVCDIKALVIRLSPTGILEDLYKDVIAESIINPFKNDYIKGNVVRMMFYKQQTYSHQRILVILNNGVMRVLNSYWLAWVEAEVSHYPNSDYHTYMTHSLSYENKDQNSLFLQSDDSIILFRNGGSSSNNCSIRRMNPFLTP